MFRRTAQWIAYFIIVIALVCGLEVIGNLPVQSQSSLPLGTHLWLVLWCALGLMIPIFVWFSRTYPPAFIVCTTAICTLDWLTLGLKYSHISPGRSVLRLDCGYRQQYTQRRLAHRIVVRMVAQ